MATDKTKDPKHAKAAGGAETDMAAAAAERDKTGCDLPLDLAGVKPVPGRAIYQAYEEPLDFEE